MIAFLLYLFLWVSPVLAQEPTPNSQDKQAKTLYKNGSRLYDEGRYKEAIQAFQEAYKLSGRHALLYNIAAAQERMGELDQALETLYQYRIYAPEKEQDTLAKRTANLQIRIEEQNQKEQAAKTEQPSASPAPVPQPQATTVVPQKSFPSRAVVTSVYTLTGVALVTSSIFAGRASAARNELRTICQQSLCPNEADELLIQDRTSAQFADIGWGISAIGLTAISLHLWRTKNIHASPTYIQWQGTFK